MFVFIKKRLEFKIIIALAFIIGCVIGVFTYVDIRIMREDTVRSLEQSLKVLATAVKGSVNAAMERGHHEDVQRIMEEVKIPSVIDRILIYNAQGRALRCSVDAGSVHEDSVDMDVDPSVMQAVSESDQTEFHAAGGRYSLSYFSAIVNRPQCYRCHGNEDRLNGILRIDFSLQDVEGVIKARRNRILLLTAVMIVSLTAALALLLRHIVHRPVRELRRAMSRAEAGEEQPLLSMTGDDELADLKKGFVAMMGRIASLHEMNIQKEKELARSQEVARFRAELQTMFDAMPDGVILADRNLRIIQSNPRAHDLLPGLDAAEGRIDPERMKQVGCPHYGIQKALKQGGICEHQCRISLPNGDYRYLHSICAPIPDEGGEGYVVEVIRDITDRVRTEQELEEKTAELQAANRLLSKVAVTDSLTQVYNRRHFDELLFKEIKRFKRRKYAYLSLMMLDIDNFKRLNDAYGHLTGDIVLRDVAKMLREGVRETDTIARYGGEEFIIVLPDTHLDGAEYKAEKIRNNIEKKEFPGQKGPVHITISIGVAAYRTGEPQDLIRAADEALYRAKHEGRNKVITDRSS